MIKRIALLQHDTQLSQLDVQIMLQTHFLKTKLIEEAIINLPSRGIKRF